MERTRSLLVARTVLRGLLVLLLVTCGACYILIGPAAIRDTIQQSIHRAATSTTAAIEADRLKRAQQHLQENRRDLKRVTSLRSEIRSQILALVKARTQLERQLVDVQRQMDTARIHCDPPSEESDSRIDNVRGDHERRWDLLLTEARVLTEQIEEAESKLLELTAGLPQIDDRIVRVQNQTEAMECEVQLRTTSLVGRNSRAALLDLLETLESRAGDY